MDGWKRRVLVVLVAMALQAGLLGLAVLIGVLDPPVPAEAPLKPARGSPTLRAEQQREAEAVTARLERLRADRLAQLADPVLASMEASIPVAEPDLAVAVPAMGAMLPVGGLFTNQLAALTDGAEGETLPPPDPVEFLGQRLTASRIVLLLDVSGSVKTKMERAGMSMGKLKGEVHRFLDQLGPNHLFGMIQFTRKWQAFRPGLVPATAAVKAEARRWVDGAIRTSGTAGRDWTGGQPNGIEAVLRAAFGMEAKIDEIFLVADGDFQRTPPGGGGQDVPWPELRRLTRDLQARSIGTTRLRVLCFHPPQSALPDLRAWVRENGPGTLEVVD